MKKIFGTDKYLSSIYKAFAICIVILLIGIAANRQEIWNKILPVFGVCLGYIFGKNS